MRLRILTFVTSLFLILAAPAIADNGVITNQSAYSADVTVERFEAAVKKLGFLFFFPLGPPPAATQMGLLVPSFKNGRAG